MTGSLSSRMLVNAVGIPGIVFLVYLGGVYFALFVTVVSLLALREFYKLSGSKGIWPQYAVGASGSLLISIFYFRGLESTLFSLTWQNVLVILILVSVILEVFRKKENGTANIA
ncbi:MAG: phosphatidate cytidylyltransferase, partial [Candidatus Neomarinimicrobiota bacterium]